MTLYSWQDTKIQLQTNSLTIVIITNISAEVLPLFPWEVLFWVREAESRAIILIFTIQSNISKFNSNTKKVKKNAIYYDRTQQ